MKRAITVVLLALLMCACTRTAYVQNGRKTILAINDAVTALDHSVAETYKDAPLDDASVDKDLARWDCAFTYVDDLMLLGWVKLQYVEEGPPKVTGADMAEWIGWISSMVVPMVVMLHMAEVSGIDTSPLDPVFEVLGDYITLPSYSDDMDLNCSEVF
jgi:hypothetical protein